MNSFSSKEASIQNRQGNTEPKDVENDSNDSVNNIEVDMSEGVASELFGISPSGNSEVNKVCNNFNICYVKNLMAACIIFFLIFLFCQLVEFFNIRISF